MLIKCSNCGKEFKKDNNRIKRSKRHFCSKECQYIGYRQPRKSTEEVIENKRLSQKEYRERPDIKQKRSDYQKKYQKENREDLNKKSREWYSKNRDDQNAKSRKRYAENIEEMREKSKERHKKWREENPDGYFLSRLRYKLNPLTRFKHRANQEIRRAKKYNCSIGDKEQLLNKYIKILSSEKINCYYCGEECGYSVPGYQKDVTIDHKTPLSKGGDHDIDNMVPCCRQCNSLKECRTEEEYKEHVKRIERLTKEL